MITLTPEQVEANKCLGLHPMFWETAIELPANPTPESMDALFPAWRVVAQKNQRTRIAQVSRRQERAS